jgi:spore coat polysaccharide biosynthesis predicted glycosyltransferase SpsG
MRYILRADSSPKSGSGHVMRLSAIAEELIARGELVIFIGQVAELPWLASRINEIGFSKILESSAGYHSNPATDVLILDSYTLPVDDSFIQPNNWRRVVTISDEFTPPYLADLTFHPSISEGWKPNSDVKFFSGPSYIPFRKSIMRFEKSPKNHRTLKILIVGGGADPLNFVEAIAKSIMNVDAQFQAILFSNNLSLSKLDHRFTCVPIGPELDVYADTAELVFTTASTTSLEFIAREMAVGVGCAVDNQKEYYKSLTQHGIAFPIGQFNEGKWNLDDQRISEIIHSKVLREKLIKNSLGILDLQGVARIVNEILKI